MLSRIINDNCISELFVTYIQTFSVKQQTMCNKQLFMCACYDGVVVSARTLVWVQCPAEAELLFPASAAQKVLLRELTWQKKYRKTCGEENWRQR